MSLETDIADIADDVGTVDVGRRPLSLTNLGKVLWPDVGFTKREMLTYYASIADALVPHLHDRPVTFKRAPDGVDGPWWYQTQCPHPPEWMRTQPIPAAGTDETWDYCVIQDAASLMWAVNLGGIELHPLLFRNGDIGYPSAVVFDLDPRPPADLTICCAVALELMELLRDLGLWAAAKTSGLAGLHVVVPLNCKHSSLQTKNFAASVARRLTAAHPDLVIADRRSTARAGKVLIDWRQNDTYGSLVAPYSVRVARVPTVSMPIGWDEVRAAAGSNDPSSLFFLPEDVGARIERNGDLFIRTQETVQSLPN